MPEIKKILYIWKGLFPWEVRVDKICMALIDNNIEVYLLCRGENGQPKEENIEGINIIRVGTNLPFNITVPVSPNPIWKKAIKNTIQKIKPDVVIAREIMLAEAVGKAAHDYDIPFLIDMAENYPAVMKGWRKYKERPLYRFMVFNLKLPEKFEKKSIGLADGIITVCKERNDVLIQDFNYPVEKIITVHNTQNPENYNDVRKGSDKPPKVIAYQGYINSERNLDNFIKGFNLASDKIPDIQLIISGTGEELNDLKNLASNMKSKNRIIFTGEYSHDQLNELLSTTDIGILPYRLDDHINQTISNKLFDYMSCGKAVIVSEAEPMKRIIDETGCGIYTDCTNPDSISKSILELVSNFDSNYSESGLKAAAEKYNWNVDKENLISFIMSYC